MPYLQTFLSSFIERNIIRPDHIVMYTVAPDIGDNAVGIRYNIQCRKCGMFEQIAAADWSKHFDLDNLVNTLLSFVGRHEHDLESPPERLFRD